MPIDLLVFGVAIIDMDIFITSITKRKNFFSNGCEIGTKVISIFANTKNGVVVLRMKEERTKILGANSRTCCSCSKGKTRLPNEGLLQYSG